MEAEEFIKRSMAVYFQKIGKKPEFNPLIAFNFRELSWKPAEETTFNNGTLYFEIKSELYRDIIFVHTTMSSADGYDLVEATMHISTVDGRHMSHWIEQGNDDHPNFTLLKIISPKPKVRHNCENCRSKLMSSDQ